MAEVRIAGIGGYIPARRESNTERLADFELNESFLSTKLGIWSRAVKESEEGISDLCVGAFQDLDADLAVPRSDIQLCCVVTQNPDLEIPHTAALLHHQLGLARSCMTFDISQGCAGYACGLAIAISVMDRLGLDRALIFTCDPYSKIVDRRDKSTALIFGDAASVSYCSRGGDGYALLDADFGTAPGTASCLVSDGVLKMDGSAVLMNATREVPSSIRALLDRNGRTIDDIDQFLLHPGSKRVIDLIRKDLKLDSSKVPFEIAEYGNTVSSSIPLMLRHRLRERKYRRLVLSGFGVGFSWGSCLIELRNSSELLNSQESD
jgi:3-oxoacyl-[acyl-carrier-protein] synthase-3